MSNIRGLHHFEKCVTVSAAPTVKERVSAEVNATVSVNSMNPTSTINTRRCIRIGQWNVRGLNALGKLSVVGSEMEPLRITVCGLSETKWAGEGHFTTLDGHTVVFSGASGGEGREHHGVAIWIHRNTAPCLISYNPASSRVISATFSAKPRNVTVVQCNAPTAEKPDNELKKFYREVKAVLAKILKRNMLIITGDFNARVGQDAEEKKVLGKYGHGSRNDRGQTLVDFCSEHKLIITNTLFRLNNRHRYTWTSPNRVTRSQIDYILIGKQWKRSVNNARTCLSADCDTDHSLVVLTIQLRFSKNQTRKPLMLDLTKLECDQVRDQYQIMVYNRFQELERVCEPQAPNEMWLQMKDAMLDAAKETLQKQKEKRKNWISERTYTMIEKKREAKAASATGYVALRSAVQGMLRCDKQNELDSLCQVLEENAKKGNARSMFQTLRNINKPFQSRTTAINDSNGKKLVEPEKVCQRWKEHCEELYGNEEYDVEIKEYAKEPPPSKNELRNAMLKVAKGKAAGSDNVAVELLRFGGDMTLDKLHQLCLEIWESGVWPEEWTQSIFIPIHKKGDKLQCNNYRTIALVSHASKILLKVVLERMQSKLEKEISPEQAGFRPNRGTRDQITNLRIILEKAREMNQKVYLCFIDFTKAFDMIRHDQLWLSMLDMGFPPHLVQLLSSLYKQQRAAVRTSSVMSAWFHVGRGVRQGCNLSPCLFNILAEQVMRKALHGFSGGFKIGQTIISNLRYADDIVLIATSKAELQDLVDRVEMAAKDYNMMINAAKTKVMTNTDESFRIVVEAGTLEQVTSFTYLGSRITSDAECSGEVKSRLAMGMSAMVELTKIWKNKSVSTVTKLRLMKALVWPVATYGCESWTLKKKDEQNIERFENKCIRKLLRISWKQFLSNEEVYKIAKTKHELLGNVKSRKLRFFGHVIRHTSESIESHVMIGHVEGKRSQGRPRISWLDNIIAWSGLEGVDLIEAVHDRSRWSALTHPCSQPSLSDDGE